jgi:hypothetical protein
MGTITFLTAFVPAAPAWKVQNEKEKAVFMSIAVTKVLATSD